MTSRASSAICSNSLVMSQIFGCLSIGHRYKTLAKCMRVCKLWETEARLELYRQLGNSPEDQKTAKLRNQMLAPKPSTLVCMNTSLERKQLYAEAVRYLKFHWDYDLHKAGDKNRADWEHLNFRHVQHIEIGSLATEYPSFFNPISTCKRLWSFAVRNFLREPSPLRTISGLCSGLRYLSIKDNFKEHSVELIKASSMLETLILDSSDDPNSQQVFNTVAHHPKLQFVDGLPIHTTWIESLPTDTLACFRSIRHIGLSPGLWDDDDDDDDREDHCDDYVKAVSIIMSMSMMHKATALHVQISGRDMIDALANLPTKHKIRELHIDDDYAYLVGEPSASEMLQCISNFTELTILRLPCFKRSRRHPPHQDEMCREISWKTVQDFVMSMPKIEEFSLAEMRLRGFQPKHVHARAPVYKYPVTWRRGLGWEIEDYEWASKMFKINTGGRYMAHDYFGPYTEEVSFAEWLDEDGNDPDEDVDDNEAYLTSQSLNLDIVTDFGL